MWMRSIERLRRALTTEYFAEEQLATVLGRRGLHAKVTRLVASAELQRLKRGFFVFGTEHRRGPVALFPIANLLYGPSYVSVESALSHYGFIPEQPREVTSVNTKRVKRFETSLGNFSFRLIPATAFPFGIRSAAHQKSHFVIALPEKALLDKLYLDGPRDDFWNFCIYSLRIEPEMLRRLRTPRLLALASSYHEEKFLKQLRRFAEQINQEDRHA